MTRYIAKYGVDSQESTGIEIAVGLGLSYALYQLVKKLSKEANQSAKNINIDDELEGYLSAQEMYDRLIAKAEKATHFNESVLVLTDASFGGSTDAAGVLKHISGKVITPFEDFLNKTDASFKKIIETSLKLSDTDKMYVPQDYYKIVKIVKSFNGRLNVNGFEFSIIGDVNPLIQGSFTPSRASEREVRCPDSEQFGRLLTAAGMLLKLMTRTGEGIFPDGFKDSPFGQSGDLFYTEWINEMLGDTFHNLIVYLDKSID